MLTGTDGNETTYKHHPQFGHRVPTELSDAEGKNVSFGTGNEGEQDINRITSVTDRLGDTTNFSYHQPTGKIASIVNNKGDIINFTYTAQNQTFTANPDEATFTFYDLARIDYPDGTHEEFTYDAKGNVLSYTDCAGKTGQYEYNACWQVMKITNPAGGVTDFTYNAADATLASSTDSDIGVTTYGYDTYKRLNRITHPDGTFVRMDYDLNDLITGITDERGMTYNFTYDANGNLVNDTDPAGNETQYAHDLMDRVTQSTNRRGKTTQYAYDSRERLASVTDPAGNTHHLAYNSRGWLNRITDPAGMVWQMSYDYEGLLNSTTTPLGYTTAFTRDKLGYITGITNQLGHSINFTRDEMSRITEASDALGRKTNYTFDERGLLTSVTRPDIGTANYTRNELGLLTNIRDLNGKDWAFAYTSIGRLQSLTDPLGNNWQYAYNERDFLNQTAYPTGETQDMTYDDSGNLVRMQYSNGTDLQFTYDNLNRLTSADNISFTYNEVERVLETKNPPVSFGATYDDSGRLETAAYADGIFNVSYQYNSRDLLTQVTDDLTGTTIEFSYDDDGRLTGITRSNDVNTSLNWDEATRLTRIRQGEVADLQYEYNAAGEITKQEYTLPLDPADYLTAETNTFTYDDASQINSTGYSYDARGRQTASPGRSFTWDGASRLTGTGSATLEYNGLGDLIKRTAGGNTTHYYYNYALGLYPVVAEKDEGTGDWQRFYVLAPTGQLLYLIDAADSNKVYFYHFDHAGNTLFLTDAVGAITDKYAYMAYGKLLHHEGTNEQPFTFGGELGVRQEGSNGDLYQMRMRYYNATSGSFLSREPIWPIIDDSLQINPYQYAADNPMLNIDPTGTVPGPAKKCVKKFVRKFVKKVGIDVGEEVLVTVLDIPVSPSSILLLATEMGFKGCDPGWGPEGAPWRVKVGIWNKWKKGELKDPGKWEKKYIEEVNAVNEAKKLRRERIDREIRELKQRLALRKGEEAHHKWIKNKRESINKVKGLWVHAGEKWLFFPGGKVLYRDYPGRHGNRAMIAVKVTGVGSEESGIWVHDVSEMEQGHGPSWW
jgi:RHS repeat-associated protein